MSLDARSLHNVPFDIHKGQSLKDYSYLHIGGLADMAFPENALQLSSMLSYSAKHQQPVYMLAKGSNILFSDEPLEALVIHLKNWPTKIERNGMNVSVQGDCSLDKLINFFCQEGLSGLEPMIGIPGSLFGSIAGNAGTARGAIGDIVTALDCLDRQGQAIRLEGDQLNFAYRVGPLSNTGFVIIAAHLRARPKDSQAIRQEVLQKLAYRKQTQPLKDYSLGCVFKNPDQDISASQLIERAGFKGFRYKTVRVSEKHANFFVHDGQGLAEDYCQLIHHVQQKVYEQFAVRLIPEIRCVGHFQTPLENA